MGVIENVKEVSELVRKYNDIELNRRILSLENEVLDLSREKRRAEEKIEELTRALEFKGKLNFKQPFYYSEGDNTPFCPGCWEARKTAIYLANHPISPVSWLCPACKTTYGAML